MYYIVCMYIEYLIYFRNNMLYLFYTMIQYHNVTSDDDKHVNHSNYIMTRSYTNNNSLYCSFSKLSI